MVRDVHKRMHAMLELECVLKKEITPADHMRSADGSSITNGSVKDTDEFPSILIRRCRTNCGESS